MARHDFLKYLGFKTAFLKQSINDLNQSTMETNKELPAEVQLIERLKECIRLHMNPYNLGDEGETTRLMCKFIKWYEELKQENDKLNESCKKLFDQNCRFHNNCIQLQAENEKLKEDMGEMTTRHLESITERAKQYNDLLLAHSTLYDAHKTPRHEVEDLRQAISAWKAEEKEVATLEGDTMPTAPNFDTLVGLIELNFKCYVKETKAFTDTEIEEGWQRYKAINHLYRDQELTGEKEVCNGG